MSWFKNWFNKQVQSASDYVYGNNHSVVPFRADATPAEIETMVQLGAQLEEAANRVEEYAAAVELVADSAGRLVEANAKIETAVINLGTTVHKQRQKLIPLRRTFHKEVDGQLRLAVKQIANPRANQKLITGFLAND